MIKQITRAAGTLCLLFSFASQAAAPSSSISGELEGEGAAGQLIYSINHDALLLQYFSSGTKRRLTYKVHKFDACSTMAVYQIPHTRQIAIDGSCLSLGGQILVEIYEWKAPHSNWCLVRGVAGERSDNFYEPNQTLSVSRAIGCTPPGSRDVRNFASLTETAMEVNVEIEALKKTIKDGTQLTEYARTVPYYAIAELVPYVSPDNVEALNRLASCLIRNGRASEATPLLQNIVAKFQAIPGAKLNLADAYWETGHQAISSRIYLEYYERAISQGIHDIPARVLERKAN
ncbi:hypothetical protein LMG19282_01997 [Cupriavidus campinensis]|uniref:tetratricopeptide repeat protein n=1 Tax=Cupriavidus campinensis TaxID=151783 RepID=UPI001B2BC115|nr:tetratricopeptide repeat protein [Cupriavidus campinensis]CAG2141116.1 hypothetical protein LMG19282_01997 [Cupriavidus campinensis]